MILGFCSWMNARNWHICRTLYIYSIKISIQNHDASEADDEFMILLLYGCKVYYRIGKPRLPCLKRTRHCRFTSYAWSIPYQDNGWVSLLPNQNRSALSTIIDDIRMIYTDINLAGVCSLHDTSGTRPILPCTWKSDHCWSPCIFQQNHKIEHMACHPQKYYLAEAMAVACLFDSLHKRVEFRSCYWNYPFFLYQMRYWKSLCVFVERGMFGCTTAIRRWYFILKISIIHENEGGGCRMGSRRRRFLSRTLTNITICLILFYLVLASNGQPLSSNYEHC